MQAALKGCKTGVTHLESRSLCAGKCKAQGSWCCIPVQLHKAQQSSCVVRRLCRWCRLWRLGSLQGLASNAAL